MAGGCAVVALLGWLQVPLGPWLPSDPGTPSAPQPGQLLHPLLVEFSTPEAAPDGWVLETVALELDGEPLLTEQPVAAAPAPLWQGELSPGPHTLVALLVFRRPGASDDDAAARVQVERPSVFHVRPGRPLALTLSRSP